MKRWTALALCVGVLAAGADGLAAAVDDRARAASSARLAASGSTAAAPHVSKRLMLRGKQFPTEDGFVWRPQALFRAFRGDTTDPCAKDRSLAPRVPHGVVSRRYEWTSDDADRILLDAARVTLVRLRSEQAAGRYFGRYTQHAFDCPRRDIAGGAGRATAVYKVVRDTRSRTAVAEKVRQYHATTIRRYIDVRRAGVYVAIAELDLGEDIDIKPDLRRVDAIADAQVTRLARLGC